MKKLIVTGNVGKNPEIRADQDGNYFANFSLAVKVGTKEKPRTDWIQVACSGKLVDVVTNYVKQGSKLLIDGKASVSAYLNKNGEAVAVQKLYADTIEFISNKESDDVISDSSDETHYESDNNTSDEIPF